MKLIHAPYFFRGGVHPEYGKERTAAKPLRTLPPPSRLVVSMAQHLGAPARPVVAVGDSVTAGQKLAEAGGFISAPVHAPLSGKVTAVEPRPTPAGRPAPAVILAVDPDAPGSETLEPLPDWANLPAKKIAERVAEAGVVGMGGAGFPTRVKLSPPPDKPVDTLILNGAECEPYLTSDHRLMLDFAREIREGCEIIAHVLGARKVKIAIENNKPDAVMAMRAACQGAFGGAVAAEIVSLDTRYPQGSEKQLIYAVTGRKVPPGGLPMDVGVLVENTATTKAVRDAVLEGKPLTERIVTVSGDAVNDPGNLRVPIGATISDLVAACGGLKDTARRILIGGPMMGFAQPDLEVPLTKTSSGILAFSRRKLAVFESIPCIGCGRCLKACPMNLVPAELSRNIEAEDIETAEALHVMDCFECGCCAYVCPAHRPLVQHMRRAKARVVARRGKKEPARS